MKNLVLPVAIVFILLASGCTSLDPTSLVKATPAVSNFLKEYPNAEVKATHYTIEESESVIDNIMSDCEKEAVTPKEYYKVTITDAKSDLDVVAWVDVKNQIVECVVKRGSAGDASAEETVTAYHECTAEEKAAEACTMEYNPVCAKVEGVGWKTFGNSCSACAEEGVLGWQEGACGVVCQSKYKVKCDEGHVYWYDSCGNKEGKKEYCPLGCSEGACITDKNVCDVGKNYLDKPSCNCPDGYEMIVVYPRCEQVQEQEEAQAQETTASGGGSAAATADGVTGQITGMPIAEAVKTEAGEVKIAEQYTTVASERCAGGQPLYRCVKKTECKPYYKSSCYGGHVYWYDSCGGVQEKKQYCENGCADGACMQEGECASACPQLSTVSPTFCPDGDVVSGGTDKCGCQLAPKCVYEDGCAESDGGYDVYIAGATEAGDQRLEDHCNDDGTLTEKYCSGSEIKWNAVACPEGYECDDGACEALDDDEAGDEDEDEVCCESFGYGSQMVECCQTYAWKTKADCAVTEQLVGGGKRIVDDSLCECTDSDGGDDIYEAGTAEASDQEYSDHCNSDGTLTEKYCENGSITAKSVECPHGCAEGACVIETP